MLKREKYDDSHYEINQYAEDELCPQCFTKLTTMISVWYHKKACKNKNCDLYYKKLEE